MKLLVGTEQLASCPQCPLALRQLGSYPNMDRERSILPGQVMLQATGVLNPAIGVIDKADQSSAILVCRVPLNVLDQLITDLTVP